ncbi:MAG: hypothetical protein HQ508_04355 [Candidatus Marinimicrobia bacterium]|nr:hypothetical protein [Candidatus Neomarinimicrobiota bacterium]
MQKSIIPRVDTNEWLEFISRLGMVSISDARNVFLSGDYSQIADLGQKTLYIAGRGKTLSLEGHLIASKMSLDEALVLAETRNAENGYSVKDEILAYVNYERGIFFEKFGESFTGLSLYRSAKRLAESNSLNSIIDYQISAHQLQRNGGSSPGEVKAWIEYFQQNQMQIMELVALRRLASYCRSQKEYQDASDLLLKGIALGSDYDYPFMVEQIKNSYGYLLYDTGELKEARAIFKGLLQGIQNKYLKSTVFENLTLTYYDQQQYDASAQSMGEAIEHSQKHDILSVLPDECLFMGDLQRDKLQQPELATHYYEIGYRVALKMAEHGFNLKGERLDVVNRFENRPKVGYSLPETLGSSSEPFAFALGQTWKQINDLFQFQLIQSHLEIGKSISDLPVKLELKTSTYYAIKRRLNQHGFEFDGKSNELPVSIKKQEMLALRTYVTGLTELSWSAANEKFEKEIIEYLFKQFGYQKTKLAEKLDVSYPTVLQKTKSLRSE